MKSTLGILMFVIAMTVMSTAAVAQEQQEPVTFTKNVAPILQAKCQNCHHAGTVAPMSLVTYQEVRPWAKSIKAKVAAGEMPPWFIDRNVGIQHFSNNEALTDEQLATLIKWVDAGAPQGNPADMPPARQFKDGETWQAEVGTPDLTVTLPKDVAVKAKGPDWWPDILVDPHLTEDRYIEAVQIIPTKGYEVIHHIRTSMIRPGDSGNNSGGQDASDVPLEPGEQGLWLSEYAIGKGADVFRQGAGRLIKAGTKINVQFHIHPNGKSESAVNLIMGLKFYPKGYTPQHTINTVSVGGGQAGIDIRPGDANARSDGYMVMKQAARILSYQPHIHIRGKAECVEAIYPTGKRETLTCTKFEFNWMRNYVYADDAAPLLPRGTVLHTTTWHDNSAENKVNPDPDAQITWGSRTVDEMGHGYFNIYYMSDEDFKKESEARTAKQKTLTSTLTNTQ